MINPTRPGVLPLALMVFFLSCATALGQASTAEQRADRANLEVQLHLLLASNETGDRNMQTTLEPVVRQLKATFPFTNYRLAATFANRVRNGGSFEGKGILSSDVFTPVTNSATFYEFTLSQVRVLGEGDAQSIDISRVRFGLSIPVLEGMSRAEGNTPATPLISYHPAGVSTELSLRDGTPTVFGTITTSKPNQLLVLVITVKRAL